MAEKLVRGYDDSKLCLDYSGTQLVLMTSPAPYAHLQAVVSTPGLNSSLSTSGNETTCAYTAAGSGAFGGTVELFMLFDGAATRTVTLTHGTSAQDGAAAGAAGIQALVEGAGIGSVQFLSIDDGPLSVNVTQPYCRWRLRIAFSLSTKFPYDSGQMWAKVAIT